MCYLNMLSLRTGNKVSGGVLRTYQNESPALWSPTSSLPSQTMNACTGGHSSFWLTYPHATHDRHGPLRLAAKVHAWREAIPGDGFRPHMTNEWIDLDDDPHFPQTPLQGGYVLRTGRHGLVELLEEWREAGVNHAALGLQMARRPAQEIIQELAEEVLPLFPTLPGPQPHSQSW